jgi:hypothetical protein
MKVLQTPTFGAGNVDDPWGAIARWPNQWFDRERRGPIPGYYWVNWAIQLPDGRYEQITEKIGVTPEGRTHVGNRGQQHHVLGPPRVSRALA